ncbi:MAG: MinD/ParA family protein [Negativicutes bacterium]|jgi:flagellar biosynthesis protein FlhG
MRDQAEKLRQLVRSTYETFQSPVIKAETLRSRVIAITSGKGGVGKTNFTVNLALALAGYGKKVLVIDADLGTANVDVILGCSARANILKLLEEGVNAEDVITDGPRGIKFMSGGSGIYQLANLDEFHLQRLITKITAFDSWADIILIDTGAGLNRTVLNFVTAADEVIIVTTPEPTSITDAYAMMKAYEANQGKAPLRLVVNRVSETEEGQLVVDKLVKVAFRFLALKIDSLGFVFEDRNLVKSVKSQKPLLLAFPNTVSAKCIEHIAERLLSGKNIVQNNGIRGFFRKFLEMVR